jgi:cytochrome P450
MFTPVAHIVRESSTEKYFTIRGQTYRIPAKTRCTISLAGLGLRREVWGDDAFEFNPARWKTQKDGSTGSNNTGQVPRLDAKGAQDSFLPWSSGPRVCPGMKMAQTEFLCVIYTIFSTYRVEPALEAGESLEEGRARIKAIIDDSQPKLTLQMNRPTDLKLNWIRR